MAGITRENIDAQTDILKDTFPDINLMLKNLGIGNGTSPSYETAGTVQALANKLQYDLDTGKATLTGDLDINGVVGGTAVSTTGGASKLLKSDGSENLTLTGGLTAVDNMTLNVTANGSGTGLKINGNSNGLIQFINGTGTASAFEPRIETQASDLTTIGGLYVAHINDNSGDVAFQFSGRKKSATTISSNAILFQIKNYTTTKLSLSDTGDLTLTGGLTAGGASSTASSTIQTANTAAFAVKNAAGTSVFNVDTTKNATRLNERQWQYLVSATSLDTTAQINMTFSTEASWHSHIIMVEFVASNNVSSSNAAILKYVLNASTYIDTGSVGTLQSDLNGLVSATIGSDGGLEFRITITDGASIGSCTARITVISDYSATSITGVSIT